GRGVPVGVGQRPQPVEFAEFLRAGAAHLGEGVHDSVVRRDAETGEVAMQAGPADSRLLAEAVVAPAAAVLQHAKTGGELLGPRRGNHASTLAQAATDG